jgi:hypothetical protein
MMMEKYTEAAADCSAALQVRHLGEGLHIFVTYAQAGRMG